MRPEGEAAPLPAKPGAVSPPPRCEQLPLCEVTRGKVQAGPYQKGLIAPLETSRTERDFGKAPRRDPGPAGDACPPFSIRGGEAG